MDETTTTGRADRVHRPLGLTLAILATAIWYGVFPLFNLYFLQRIGAAADETFLGGVSIATWDYVNALLGGITLILCILAWWGRPSWSRFALIAAILIPTFINLYRIYEVLTEPEGLFSGGSAEAAWDNVLRCQLPGLILVPLYVIWYLNRAPARAFYRRIPLAQLGADEATAEQSHS